MSRSDDPKGMWYIEDAPGGSALVLEVGAGCGGGEALVATFELREHAEAVVATWNERFRAPTSVACPEPSPACRAICSCPTCVPSEPVESERALAAWDEFRKRADVREALLDEREWVAYRETRHHAEALARCLRAPTDEGASER